MILAGFTGLGLGAGSLAFASIPDVAEMICACCHKTVSTDSLEPPPAWYRTLPAHQTHEKRSKDNAKASIVRFLSLIALSTTGVLAHSAGATPPTRVPIDQTPLSPWSTNL